MTVIHDVLRYLLARVPHSTQDEHDRIAALIDNDGAEDTPVPVEQDNDGEDTPPVEQREDGAQTTAAPGRGGRKS
jgi:hypothetical protein